MKKLIPRTALSNRFSLMFITLLLVVGAGCIYYFFHLKEREEALNQHYYRAMKHIEENLGAAIDGNIKLTKGHAFSAVNKLNDNKGGDTLLPGTTKAAVDQLFADTAAPWAKAKITGGPRLDTMRLVPNVKEESLTYRVEKDSVFRIELLKPGKKDSALQMIFRFTSRSVLSSLIRTDIFDEFILVRGNHVAFETFSSGYELTEHDSAGIRPDTVTVLHTGRANYRTYAQPVNFGTGSSAGWLLVGLRSSDAFSAEKNFIPRSYRFSVFLLLLFAVLALPFIKSLVMSRTERLNTSDAVFAILSLAATVSLVTLLLFDGYLYFSVDRKETNTQLSQLSDAVAGNLKNEIIEASKELNRYDSLVSKDSRCLLADSSFTCIRALRETMREPKYYKGYSFMFMVDSKGKTCYDSKEDYSFNVSSRSYFKHVRDGKCWVIPGVVDSFYVDAIVSWREAQFRAVISKPAPLTSKALGKFTALALTTELRSVIDPVVPAGYGFCIVDRSGKVYFHSDRNKALNENFAEECRNDPALISALYERTNKFIDLDYSGDAVTVYTRPLDRLPFSVIAFTQHSTIDNAHGQVTGMTMAFQTAILLLYLLLGLLIYLSGSRESRLVIPRFSFASFLPRQDKTMNYIRAFIFNALFGIVLLGFSGWKGHPLLLFCMFFSAPLFTIFFNYFLLWGKPLLGVLRMGRKEIRNTIILSGMLLFMNLLAAYYLDNWWRFGLFELLVIVSYALAASIPIPEVNKSFTKPGYRAFIYAFLLSTCVLPTVRFAELAYNKEKEIAVKRLQLDAMNAFGKQPKRFLLGGKTSTLNYGNYVSAISGTQLSKAQSSEARTGFSNEENHYDVLAAALRPIIQETGARGRSLGVSSNGSGWVWKHGDSSSISLCVSSPSLMPQTLKDTAEIRTPLAAFAFPPVFGVGAGKDWLHAFGVWLMLAVLLIILYRVLAFFLRRIFILQAHGRRPFAEFDKRFHEKMDADLRLFITGLPCSGKSDYFINLYKDIDRSLFRVLDFVNCESKDWQDQVNKALVSNDGVLLIDHFEFAWLDSNINKIKLDLLEKLSQFPGKKVVIVSAIHPQAFLELYITPADEPQADKENLIRGDRWTKALSCFYNLYFPLQGDGSEAFRLLEPATCNIPGDLLKMILRECDHGQFLRRIGSELIEELSKYYDSSDPKVIRAQQRSGPVFRTTEDLVVRIQQLAHVYYLAIWTSLTKEEQYVLFDLAQDGIVNPKNTEIVTSLIDKGLVIVRHERIEVMNLSFRNFILSVIEPGDMMKLESSVRDAGNWNRFKMPLLVLVCGLALFIFRTDQNSETMTYITTFAAGIPIILNLLAVFRGQAGSGGGAAKKKE